MAPPTESIYYKYFYPVGFAIMGFGTPAVTNYYNKRPLLSGIQRHMTYGVIGIMFGFYVREFFKKKWAERDAMVRHYIELHPEDFVRNRRKYKEVFDVWYPIR